MRCRGHVTVNGHNLEAVDSFCYLRDIVRASVGTSTNISIRRRAAWEKFRKLLPLLTKHAVSLQTCGRICTACVRSVMLYASECWALRNPNDEHNRLIHNDRAMARWIYGIRPEEKVNTPSLSQRFNIPHLDNTLRCNRWQI